MNITLPELEDYLSLSRHQISRYANDGRLTRTGQGQYDAASLANLATPFERFRYHQNIDEEKALWLVREEYAFRRTLRRLIENRHFQAGKPSMLSDAESLDIERSVAAYTAILQKR